jgi:prepilin-type processing-associated H-X9-DG protein
MRRAVMLLAAAFAGLVAVGLLVTWVVRGRALQDRLYCENNLRELYVATFPMVADKKALAAAAVPAGTVVVPGLPPDRRLSWFVPVLPGFNQRRQPTADLVAGIDPAKPNDAEGNAAAGGTVVRALLCPANVPDRAGVTMYVGLAGVGADAATLGLGPPVPPAAGAFRYDAATPLAAFADGLSNTLLFAETADPGRWLHGGPDTVRGLLPDRSYLGAGSQFGGSHAGGANFALADGGVRFLTDRIDPGVLRTMATIAGGPDVPE